MARRADQAKYALESVDRMAAVFAALESARELSLDQVARHSGLNSSTALRYLLSLGAHGLVERDEDSGLFRLGLRLFRLGSLAIESRDVLSVAGPLMADLQAQFGESVNLAMRQGDRVVLLRVLNRPDSMRSEGRPGDADPWHATAVGKAILSALPAAEVSAILRAGPLQRFTPNTRTDPADLERDLAAARAAGYSVDDEEVVEGLRCVGVPVRDLQGRVHYGLSLSGPRSRMSEARVREIGAILIDVADDLSRRLWAPGMAGAGAAAATGT